ncbi:MAG TPA: acyl-CoA dehydrogenase family protein, partial [Ktedonobacterales bacterium]
MPKLEAHAALRAALRELCARFPAPYWRELDQRRAYPEAFVAALTAAGYLGALIPQEYGGLGMRLTEASIIVEEINRSGGNAGPYHAQMYTMGTILRHGSDAQKRAYLPAIARGELRLQAFGVTEPEAGTDTASITTTATRAGDRYRINGRKAYLSRVQHSDLLLLLARTAPRERARRRTDGLSMLLVDLREALGHGLTVTPIQVML